MNNKGESMPFDYLSKIEVWIGFFLGGVATMWKGVTAFFRVKNKTDQNSDRLDSMDTTLDRRFQGVSKKIEGLEKKNEEEHTRIEKQLQKLLDLHIKP